MVHACVLSGAESLAILTGFVSSEIAVKSFFVVSGFLIFRSYENSVDIKNYFVKRIRRIYPAYFSIVMICAVFGSFFSVYTWDEYFSPQILKYLSVNLLFLNFMQPDLPGLFESNSLRAVNGALWTLKIEVMFYLFVPLAVMSFRRFGRLPVLIIIYICSIIYSLVMEVLTVKTGSGLFFELQRQLPGQLAFFIAGAAGYYYFHYFAKYAAWLAALAAAAFVLQKWLPWVAVQPVALAVLVVCFACVVPCLGNFGKHGDFSYGIYIVHFPILQILIAYGLFKESPWTMLFIAGVLVAVAAFLLWNFVEKPFLRKSSHYLAASQG